MSDFQTNLEKYAELVLRMGVNLQNNQTLMVNAPTEAVDFVRVVAKKAYELGAKDIHMNWMDEELSRLKYEHAPLETLETVPQWRVDMYDYYAEDGAAVLSIKPSNPDLLKGIDPSRIAASNKANGNAMKNFRNYTMNDRLTWCVAAVPGIAWAEKVFPDAKPEEAKQKLWEQIFTITRADQEDPIEAWHEHNQTLATVRDYLNDKQYQKLIYKAPGTDLELELPEGHVWKGGASPSEKGTTFNANIPTEEVFTMPHKYGVNGTVTNTKPLNYGGNLIDNFTLTFKDGKVVDFTAEEGHETLKHLLDTDEGSTRLGEVALVPHESPISQSGLIFYNTLYDENASCHLALGKAYPTSIQGGSKMDDEALDQNGVNNSLVHVDFMMGSGELDVYGVTKEGQEEPVLKQGSWAMKFN
ncbi:aminopeptidase [Salinibacillus xinjiangensis]|uniref:Aminopeptidase n=1 Tax=Salinibacillus xinjiangensis TaxID=1229268 RepID=A0A6G1X467_9BACI|nr:aminopeptidase [Salinibacillus xinjiangensis]MRG85696.1 aminopeptidase [Salinibacillus xinjiangensis]